MEDYKFFGIILESIAVLFNITPILFGLSVNDSIVGVIYTLLTSLMMVSLNIISKNTIEINIDIFIIFTGLFSSVSGTLGLILTEDGMQYLNTLDWLIIILTSIFSYYTFLFFTKGIQVSWINLNSFFSLALVSIILSFSTGILFFNYSFSVCDFIGLAIMSINNYFYTSKVIKSSIKLKEKSAYELFD